MKQLVLWNNTLYASTLATAYGAENVITNYEDFVAITKQLDKYSSMIVLCELDWPSNEIPVNLEQLLGIELVKEMRRVHELKIPVLFTSFLSLSNIFNPKREILTAIGHSFLKLPALPQSFASLLSGKTPLSETELVDVQIFSCSSKGIIDAKIHQIQSVADLLTPNNAETLKSKLEQCLKEIHSVYKADADICLSQFRNRFVEIKGENIYSALDFIKETGDSLINQYNVSLEMSVVAPTVRKLWKLLLLDDELNENSELVKQLYLHGVEVICTSTAEEAMDVLTADDQVRGKIVLILTDYRLYDHTEEVPVQQRKQGYAFLHDVGNKFQSRLLSAMVYSGMPRRFLMDTFKTYRVRTEIYSKMDYKPGDPSARNFIVNRIIETGDANYEALLALPMASGGWEKHLHSTYLLYRAQNDYYTRERIVSDYCKDWIDRFRQGESPVTPMIKGDAFKPKDNETELQTLDRFEAYFKTRRLAQYLHLYYENNKVESDPMTKITGLLASPGKKMDTDELRRGFLSQIIGFKREEFPFGATIEELIWFDRDMEIPVLDSYSNFRRKFNETENLIGSFISGINVLSNMLNELNFTIRDKRKIELRFDANTCNPFLFDKTDYGICLEWLNKSLSLFDKSETEDFLTLLSTLKALWK